MELVWCPVVAPLSTANPTQMIADHPERICKQEDMHI